jgi:hypothetical protein
MLASDRSTAWEDAATRPEQPGADELGRHAIAQLENQLAVTRTVLTAMVPVW